MRQRFGVGAGVCVRSQYFNPSPFGYLYVKAPHSLFLLVTHIKYVNSA